MTRTPGGTCDELTIAMEPGTTFTRSIPDWLLLNWRSSIALSARITLPSQCLENCASDILQIFQTTMARSLATGARTNGATRRLPDQNWRSPRYIFRISARLRFSIGTLGFAITAKCVAA